MKLEKNYPGLCKEKTAVGSIRWRVRVEGEPGKRLRLPDGMSPGTPGFEEAYASLREGKEFVAKSPDAPVKKGSLDELCVNFEAWMETQVSAGQLSPLTLRSRRTGLGQARNCRSPGRKVRMGELGADLPMEAFVHILDSFKERTAAAETCLKALRAAYKWGKERGHPKYSPVFELKSNHQSGGVRFLGKRTTSRNF